MSRGRCSINGIPSIFIAYLIGSIPFGYLIVRLKEGRDVRSTGSGNIGATNVLRTAGRGSALMTLLLDATKGYLAVWLASWISHDSPQTVALAAISAVLGHLFPVFLKFKGGKGVATVSGSFPVRVADSDPDCRRFICVRGCAIQVCLPGFDGRGRCVSCSLSSPKLSQESLVMAVPPRHRLP